MDTTGLIQRIIVFFLLAQSACAIGTFSTDNVRSKVSPRYNVKTYGAAGDGTTDDSRAIRLAVEAAEPAGGTVFFPAGTYLVATGISHDPDGTDTWAVSFEGLGPNVSKIHFSGTGNVLTIDDGGSSHVYYSKIQGLRFYGDQAANNGGVLMKYCHRWSIVDSMFNNFTGHGLELQGSDQGLILNSRFALNTGSGLYLTNIGAWPSPSVEIRSCTLDWNEEYGIKIGGASQFFNIGIEGCTIISNGLVGIWAHGLSDSRIGYCEINTNDQESAAGAAVGIELVSTTYQTLNVEIANTNMINHDGLGLKARGSDLLTVHNCRFSGNDAAMDIDNTNTRVAEYQNFSSDDPYLSGCDWTEGWNFDTYNEIQNGSFFAWPDGTSASNPQKWTGSNVTVDKETTTVHKADQAVKLTATGNWGNIAQGLSSERVTQLRGQRLTLTAWVYVPSGQTSPSKISISYDGPSGNSVYREIVTFASWHFVTLSTVIPSDATTIFVRFYANAAAANDSEIMYISLVTLRQGDWRAPFSPHPKDALKILETTFTWNPGNLIDGAGETKADVSVTGAVFGDKVLVAAPYSLQGLLMTPYVHAADTIGIRLQHEVGGADIDLASGTWDVVVMKK